MQEFPFQKVYDHFARALVLSSPIPVDFAPSLVIVRLDGDEIIQLTPLPSEYIALFFRDLAGKEALGDFLRMAMERAAHTEERVCIAMIAESYYKSQKAEGKTLKELSEERKGKSLEDDPDASECVMIMIHRPEAIRMGALFLNKDRSLNYSELLPNPDMMAGRLSKNPDAEDATHH